MDVWQWLYDYEQWAVRSGTVEHRQLPMHYYQGSRYLRAQETDRAFAAFTQGLHLAEKLGLPCWQLFLQFWCLETRTYYQSRIAEGLDLGIRATTLAHKPGYQDCPGRAQLFFAMAEIYGFMDSIGYQKEIEDLIDYILSETHPDDDTRHRIIYLRACIAYEKDDLDAAEALISEYMSCVQGYTFRETFFHTHMRRIAFARGDIPAAFDYAQEGVNCARWAQIAPVEGWNRMWSAALAQRMGNEVIAERLYHAAIWHYETHQLTKSIEYYDAACDYHEGRGAVEQALMLREEQADAMQAIGSIQYQCHCALQTARLLGRMGEDTSAAIQTARDLAQGLKRPQAFLDKVIKVEQDDFSQYHWQQ